MIEKTAKPAHQAQLARSIRMGGASLISLNSMIGAGIFALPATIAMNAGVLSPYLFLLVGAVFASIVLVFAELASHYKETGGPVLYVTETFGPFAGFYTGWLIFLSRMTAAAANSTVLVVYLGKLIPYFADGLGRVLIITLLFATLAWANMRGIKNGVRTIGFLTLLKMTPLLALIALGLPHVAPEHLIPSAMPTVDDFGGTALLVIYAFVGFEAVTFTAGETQNANRTIPKAMLHTLTGTAIFYFFLVLVFIALVPNSNASSSLADAALVVMGPMGVTIIAFAAVFSIAGNLASSITAVPRLVYSLGEQKLLPEWFSRVHPQYHTPHKAILFMATLAWAFALTGSFVWLAVASTLARLIAYGLCAAAIPFVRKKYPAHEESFRTPFGLSIPVIAFALCLWMA